MYSDLKDFFDDWQTERRLTITLLSGIEESKKTVKINENLRSLERLAWHLTQTLTEMLSKCGIFEKDVLEDKPIPGTMKEIIRIYSDYSADLAKLIDRKWQGKDLNEKIGLYGEMWEKRKILMVLVKHQIHHRGQMTSIMRMLDMRVPGLYGPSREEWADFGMEAQE